MNEYRHENRISVHFILAVDESGVLGRDGGMAWEPIQEDMNNFKTKTYGKVVVMGSNTWFSLPQKFRPLPGRVNVVMTNSGAKAEEITRGGGIPCCSGLENLRTFCIARGSNEIWVIGGKQIYELFLGSSAIPYFRLDSIHCTLVKGHRASNMCGVALPQEELSRFTRMPMMVDPVVSLRYLGLSRFASKAFDWGRIDEYRSKHR